MGKQHILYLFGTTSFPKIVREHTIWKRYKYLILSFLFNCGFYWLAKAVTAGAYHYDMTIPFDDRIPLIHSSIIIYFGAYFFWFFNYLYACTVDSTMKMRFFSAELLGKTVCFLFFLVLPTTAARPEATDGTFWERAIGFLYAVDSCDALFPSIHCFNSWFAYIAVRGREDVPKDYRAFSLLFALAVCVSTLTTKQHVFVDTVSGVLLAEAVFRVTDKIGFTRLYEKIVK